MKTIDTIYPGISSNQIPQLIAKLKQVRQINSIDELEKLNDEADVIYL